MIRCVVLCEACWVLLLWFEFSIEILCNVLFSDTTRHAGGLWSFNSRPPETNESRKIFNYARKPTMCIKVIIFVTIETHLLVYIFLSLLIENLFNFICYSYLINYFKPKLHFLQWIGWNSHETEAKKSKYICFVNSTLCSKHSCLRRRSLLVEDISQSIWESES